VSTNPGQSQFTPELKSGAVKVALADWSLPPGELWAAFPTGRQASAKARAFTMFMERQLSEEAG
jgi:DNA-binding transcriptional LysR family regulator